MGGGVAEVPQDVQYYAVGKRMRGGSRFKEKKFVVWDIMGTALTRPCELDDLEDVGIIFHAGLEPDWQDARGSGCFRRHGRSSHAYTCIYENESRLEGRKSVQRM